MTQLLSYPGQPYLLSIPGGFVTGRIAHIAGILSPTANSILLKFQTGSVGDPTDEVGLCIYVRMQEGIFGRNSFTLSGGWGQEEATPTAVLVRGQPFELTVLCDPTHFKIAVHRQHFAEYRHRISPHILSHLHVMSPISDLQLTTLWIEDLAAPQMPLAGPAAPMPGVPGGAYQQQQFPVPSQGNQGACPTGAKSKKGLLGMVENALSSALGTDVFGKSQAQGQTSVQGCPYSGNPYAGPMQTPGGGVHPYGGGPLPTPGGGVHPYGGPTPGPGGSTMDTTTKIGAGLLGAAALKKIGVGKLAKYGVPLASGSTGTKGLRLL